MAKSLRSKTKRAFRSKKRETGVYAAAAAARLNRLNTKLLQTTKKDAQGDEIFDDEQSQADAPVDTNCIFMYITLVDSMTVDSEHSQQPQRVSTHGPRNSRREEWRKSKGLPARNAPNGMNRQGGVAARRKAGRSKRRR
ncbi:hypothetical protein CVT24_004827 [Panaeolus cyanescens]|uniref:DUF2423 domain-containing protein n=1 Tax=Panaeolus cyanescens TaxID=181874 RepID=A0A409W1Z3_9AGAR|nr:hypothetical protein CVT24_004827 [Panaeolus cyanescens]